VLYGHRLHAEAEREHCSQVKGSLLALRTPLLGSGKMEVQNRRALTAEC